MSLPGQVLQGILARGALVLLRVYLGVVFLVDALPRVQQDFTPGLTQFLRDVGLQRAPQFYQRFLEQVVLPNAPFFAALITWAELVVGITLILGLLTRLSAALALVLTLSCLLARGGWFWSSDAALVAIALALLLGAAGRTLGLDAILVRRWPRSPLW
jgi:uncharacterized membrane protein YphA (DoxX/SURF4 family)